MKNLKKSILFILMFIIVFNTSCGKLKKSETSSQKKKMTLYIDIKDRYTQDIIKTLIDGYKKENSDVEIQTNSPLESSKLKDDVMKGGIDLLMVSRSKMLELYRDGVLSELSDAYAKNKLNERYYNIVNAYGRIGDKYYGIGLMPYTMEVFYNKSALKKLGISEPKNPQDLAQAFKKLTASKTEIPVVLNEGIDIKNAATSLLFNSMLDPQQIENAFDAGKEKYGKLNVQQVFDALNTFVKQGYFNEDSFETASETSVTRLTTGDIPALIGISYITKDLKDNKTVDVLEKYDVSTLKSGIPVIINAVLSMPANTKNEEAVNDFVEYIYSDKTQKALVAKGFVTGNKAANKEIKEKTIGTKIGKHLEEADSNIFYEYNFPSKFLPYIDAAITNILEGKYTGKEWTQILGQVYK